MKNPFNDVIYYAKKKEWILLKAVYSNGRTFVVMVAKDLFYYGDGEKTNAFGENAVQFLRFNPHLKDVSEERTIIPDNITREIKKHLAQMKKD